MESKYCTQGKFDKIIINNTEYRGKLIELEYSYRIIEERQQHEIHFKDVRFVSVNNDIIFEAQSKLSDLF